MENRRRRKFVHIALLLMSSIFIATASAAVYNLMYMDAVVTPYQAKVYFTTQGADDAGAADSQVGTGGTYVTFNSLSGWPNATRVYQKVVVIKNDNSNPVTCNLRVYAATGTANLIKLDFKIGSTILDARNVDNNINFTISGGGSVNVMVEVLWKPDVPITDKAVVTLQLTVPGEGDSE